MANMAKSCKTTDCGENSCDFTSQLSLHSVLVIAGVCWTKSQSPRYFRGWGVVTNDCCINIYPYPGF